MRRGLLTWDPAELPLEALNARVAKVRAAMKSQQLDALIAYTNISKPAAVSWISGFTPYWSEGLLYVPAEGEIAFATALSKRVAEWISTVMPQGEIIPTPQPGVAIGKRLAASGAKRIGFPDLEDMPARQAKDLLANAPGIELCDATDMFNSVRGAVDDAERRLVRKAASIAFGALGETGADAATAQELIAPCEGYARGHAAEEIFLACVPDLASSASPQRTDTATALADTFALRLSVAYKAGWVRVAKSFARDKTVAERFAAADAALARLQPSHVLEQSLRDALAPSGARLRSWSAEQPRGSYPLATVAGSAMSENGLQIEAPFTLNVEADIGGVRWIAARPFA